MAQSGATFVPDLNRLLNPLARGFERGQQRELDARKLALTEELQRANLDVNQREILLKEQQRLDQQTTQQGIQDVLTQQLGGGSPDGGVAQTGAPRVVPGDLAITPGGSIGVSAPSRLKPLTQSVADKQRDISLKLLGFGKAGREALSSVSGIFDAENEQAALQAKQDIEDTQIFALKLDRAKTRQAKNKLIEDQQSQEILDTGEISQELLRMRNMSDDELQGEIISDLAIGENLKEYVDNRLIPPVDTAATSSIGKPSPKDFTAASLEKFKVSGNFSDLVAVERPPDRRGREQFSRGTSFQGRNAAGENVLFTPILDKFSGKLNIQEDVLPGQLISRIGETPLQTQERAIQTAGGTTTARGQATRIQTTITDGVNAAEGLATLNRSLELLETIKTGGIAGAQLRFEQFLGIQGADEAELGANLLRTVLAQLRPTFGAQFTEREGTKLERIEAGIGKSTAGNIRVLKQLKVIVEREARRGISAAKQSKDTFSAEEIDRLMKFKISAPGATPPAQSPAPADQASPFTIRRIR